MKRLLMALLVFVVACLLFVPLLLLVYQIGLTGSFHWDLTRIPADRMVATSSKAVLLAVAATAIYVLRPRMGRSPRG